MADDLFPVRMIDPSFAVYHYDMELASSLCRYVDDFVLYAPTRQRDPTYSLGASTPPIRGLTVSQWRLAPEERLLGVSGASFDYIFNQGYSLLAVLRTRPKPLVHVQFLTFLQKKWIDLQWLKIIKGFSARLVYTVHNVLPHDREDDPELKRRYLRVYHLVDRLVVHAKHQQEILQDEFDVPNEKITLMPMGVHFSHMRLPERSHARHRLQVQEEPVLLHFGAMRPYKGTENLLRAFADFRSRLHAGILMLVGPASPARRDHLLRLIESLNLTEHVVCRFDFIPASEVALYFAAADLAVLPYLHIDQSAVLLTAMSLGVPVVVTAVGGFPELIGKQDLGFMCQPDSVESLAMAMSEAAQDLPGARAKARRAQEYVKKHHSWDLIARQTVEMYRQLV